MCDDDNPCTYDNCVGGECQHPRPLGRATTATPARAATNAATANASASPSCAMTPTPARTTCARPAPARSCRTP